MLKYTKRQVNDSELYVCLQCAFSFLMNKLVDRLAFVNDSVRIEGAENKNVC